MEEEQFYYVMRYRKTTCLGWDIHNRQNVHVIHRYNRDYSFVPGGTLEENAAECCRRYNDGELTW